MSAEKRPASNAFASSQMMVKRRKSDASMNGSAVTLANGSHGALVQGILRPSGLEAPVMELTGHEGEVFATRFSPSGDAIASGSMDRKILLWRTTGSCANYGILSGHKAAVLDLQFSSNSGVLFSCSADTTVASWDLEVGMRIRRHEGHEEVVNAIDIGRRGGEMLVSGGDDGGIGLWDPRLKYSAAWMGANEDGGTGAEESYPVTAVALAEAGNEIYSGGIDNDIKVWDMRKRAVIYRMPGHTDTVTSLALSPDGQTLLSHSHDGTVRTWDVRPFAPTDRSLRTYDGAPAGIDRNLLRASWDAKGERIAAGSGDCTAVVWEARTGRLLSKLPGHKGTVNDVRFSPTGGTLLSASTDRTLLLGELGS